ncbi:phage scaffolding protein [Fusobacterium ulcerans]|uniref:phage scaffolding protein n=1 Tax=Fusobacterium ulcerans TaxID=861 RepID=UPI003FEFF4FB
MTKEQLITLGVSEELATKIAGESKKELEGYIEKSRYSELEAEKNQLTESQKTLAKQLEDVKKNSGDNAELKKQIEEMQSANKAKEKEYTDSLIKIKLDNAVEIALMSSGAKNSKAVKALLNLEKAALGEDGKIAGLEEQLKALKTAEDSSFLFAEAPKVKGANPTGNPGKSGNVDFKTMSYSQIEQYLAENPGAKIDDII